MFLGRMQSSRTWALTLTSTLLVHCKHEYLIAPKYSTLTILHSRRGLEDSPLIELLVFHPHYVHVPTPSSSSSSKKGKGRQRDESTLSPGPDEPPALPKGRGRPKRIATIAQERQDTFLADEVLKRLKGCDIFEATISETGRKWTGVVRVKSEDGGILYRRMDLQ